MIEPFVCGIMKVIMSLISVTHRGEEPVGMEDERLLLST